MILKVDIWLNFLILCTDTLLSICSTSVYTVLVELTKYENKIFLYNIKMKELIILIKLPTSKINFLKWIRQKKKKSKGLSFNLFFFIKLIQTCFPTNTHHSIQQICSVHISYILSRLHSKVIHQSATHFPN